MDSWEAAARDAQVDYYRLLTSSPAAETRPVGDGFAVATGIFSNTENGVVCSRFDGDVEEVCRWFQERYAPATWLGAEPELRERGCGVAVLGPTPESRRLYAQFGFTVTPLRDGVVYLPLEPAGR